MAIPHPSKLAAVLSVANGRIRRVSAMGQAQLTIDDASGACHLTRQDAGSGRLGGVIAAAVLMLIPACILREILPLLGPEHVAQAPWPLWLGIECVVGPLALLLIVGVVIGAIFALWAIAWPWLGGVRTVHLDAGGLTIRQRLPAFAGGWELIPFERLRAIRLHHREILADVEQEDGSSWPEVVASDLGDDDVQRLFQFLSRAHQDAAAEWSAQGLHIGHRPTPADASTSPAS